ncbi:Undecaprenyl phosphate-alpha-4-amino-4-deoxy-L-arabinose arabinosyl transferase [Cupriavidus pinatubonensis]|uniref:Undecaprenyl phosphate-alpha-4-amino-4-deoxy-L-arabinose arabinosyl transferase n=1 Tax=Cupriavidus pinatubonensis TaxID=248026 RepID=A0ABM8WFZ0_9BURK|nr:Undecaprenyl phosphate-alpha-4-amino-4-deoxy-L-arabinose arabinosyl transferase [Cupriavidus pinatubonensis]
MKRQISLALAIGLALVLWIATLSVRPLYEPDEGRYAEVPREMYVSGDWITPRLNGIKFFDKPPLQYWATASAYELFGPSEWTARVWSALVGLFGALVAWWAARSLYGSQIGFAAALALTGAPLWILGSNLTTTDIGVGALLGSAVLVFAVAFQKSDSRLYPMVWLLVGLAFLAKGLIAVVLPAATLLAYACLTRQYARFLSARFWRWSLLALLVSTPWLVIVSLRNPEFLNYFFIHEHFARFSSSIHERDKPFWFFIVVTLAGVLPFAGLLPRTFALNPRYARISRSFDSRLFLSLWVLVVLVFFSLSKSKLPLYILPAFPPLAVLIAQGAMSAAPSTLGLSFLSLPVLGAAIGFLLWHPTLSAVLLKRELSNASLLHYWGGITMLILVIGGLISFATATRGRPLRAYAIASLATLASLQAGLMASRAFESLSIKPIGLQAKAASRSDSEFFNVGQIDRGLAFYSEMAPVIVGARSELDMGFDAEPSKWIPNEDAFVARWTSPGHKLAVMRTETFQRLRPRLGNETTQLSRNGANVLVQRQ